MRWRWKPRIYSTRGELSNNYTTDGDGNPGSTAPETRTLTITPLRPRIYSTRGEHSNHYTTGFSGVMVRVLVSGAVDPGFPSPSVV
jgi:hypothetical protein